MAGHGGSNKAVLAALGANLGIAIAKVVGFLVTGASSMLAEAIHSFADCGNQVLLLVGGKRAAKAADEGHAFGHGRERFFWAFLVGIVLFTLGGGFAVYEGVEKILHPHELSSPLVAVIILCIGIVLEGLSFRTAVKEANKLRKGSWRDFIHRTKNPELSVVLLEDAAALTGLVIALVGIGLSIVTGNAIFDGVSTLLIGLLLMVVAIVVGTEMKSLLIGESASREDRKLMEDAIKSVQLVERIIHMRTQHLSPEEILVAVKVAVAADEVMGDVAVAIDEVESKIRQAVPAVNLVFVETDVDHGPRKATQA